MGIDKNCRLLVFAIALSMAVLTVPRGAVGWPQGARQGSAQQRNDGVREDKSIRVPMRDGVSLSTDLYFPESATDQLPTILIRTAYDKAIVGAPTSSGPTGRMLSRFIEEGYAVAIQDMRGRFESDGLYRPATIDRDDAYDTVTWLAEQPWSNQKVATYGCSYHGDVQVVLASTRHPNHVAALPMASTTGYYAHGRPWIAYDGGVFELAQTAGWYLGSGSKIYYGPPPWVDRKEWFASDAAKLFRTGPERDRTKMTSVFWTLPTIDVLKKSGSPPTDYEDFISNNPEGPYFKNLDWVGQSDRFDVPALFIDSWYDYGQTEALQLFNLFQKNAVSARARDNQFIMIAPTTHCDWMSATENTIVGERDLGDARRDFLDIYLRWYERWFKDVDNGITDMPKVQYYLMGKNEWRGADAWPLPNTEYRTFYLHSDGRANSRYGDGSLSMSMPGEQPPDRFVYDPATPVPTLGGQTCCTGMDTAAGGYDQSTTEMRNDVLVYTSPPLEEGLDVTGELEVFLYVGSSVKDTDFTAKLVDVYPDGTAYNIQEGALRMRYREGFDKKLWMQEGEVYEIRLDLHATSNYFGPGHRIRLDISSSNFPRWDRNLNTGGNNYDETEWLVAENSVHHTAAYPSHIVLPVIR